MKDSGGFCFPDFVKKDVNVWFAIDNIDLLEDTPTGQETFHGTVIVINQQDEDGEPINEPLTVPDKLSGAPLAFEKKILPEPIIKSIPMKFNNYKIGERNNLFSTDFTHTWALANYFANGDKTRPPSSDDQLINEETRSREDKQNCTGSSTDTNGNDSALSVKEQDLTCKSEKVPKNDGMPTWAATNSFLTHVLILQWLPLFLKVRQLIMELSVQFYN